MIQIKNKSLRTLLLLAIPMSALAFTACGKKTETETKTVIIEKRVETPTTVTREVVVTQEKDGHLERAGKKVEQKVGREFDKVVDDATK